MRRIGSRLLELQKSINGLSLADVGVHRRLVLCHCIHLIFQLLFLLLQTCHFGFELRQLDLQSFQFLTIDVRCSRKIENSNPVGEEIDRRRIGRLT
jgi:hypothetical protein